MSSRAEGNKNLSAALDEFAAACPGYQVQISYEATPEIFAVTSDELDEMDPFAWPHQYRIALYKLWLGWLYPVTNTVVADAPGAVRAMTEGIQLGVAETSMIDWVWTRIAVPQV